MDDNVPQALGRIEGKLDQVIETFREHREDDQRRFGELYKTLGEHAADINKAKGARGTVLWLASGVGVTVGALALVAAKALGLQ